MEAAHWYELLDRESLNECRDRRLLACPLMTPTEHDQLRQLLTATWDGNLVSKAARDYLHSKNLIVRFSGWQVISKEGLAVLDTLGEMKP